MQYRQRVRLGCDQEGSRDPYAANFSLVISCLGLSTFVGCVRESLLLNM